MRGSSRGIHMPPIRRATGLGTALETQVTGMIPKTYPETPTFGRRAQKPSGAAPDERCGGPLLGGENLG